MKAYVGAHAQSHGQRDQLIIEHVAVAKRIALRVARRCPNSVVKDDLVSAAMLGLAEAADRFDPEKNEAFIAYAEKRIRGAVLDELRRYDIMPRRLREQAKTVGLAIQMLERKLARRPEDHEVAEQLDVPLDTYQSTLEVLTHAAVVNIEGIYENRVDSLNTRSHLDEIEKRDLLREVERCLRKLPERDALILSLHYTEEFTYAEISKLLGVSISRVCQLHGRALARLRVVLEKESEDG